jgi:hypothetical protein
MDCGAVRGLINRYIDGELGYVETAGLQQHLDFCADCSAELRELSGLRGALAAWGRTQLVPPPRLADRVMGAVERQALPGEPRPMTEVLDEALERIDRSLGRVPLPGGRTIPVKNLIGWGLAVAAVVIGLERRYGRDETEVRAP